MSRDVALLVVLVALVALLVGAYRTRVPYPIWLVVGGAALGFAPGLPDVKLQPEVVLILLLPPLLYSSAFFSSLRELQANLRPIALLAIGLVLFTTVGVASVAHLLVGLSWPVSFVVGAILSPTDPTAASAIASRVGAPRRVITIVEGEALINDSTALIVYGVAVGAVVTGDFSATHAVGEFFVNVTAGIAIGLAVGWVVAEVRGRIVDPPTEITISVVTPFLAYLPAEALGVSAVVAAVTAGIFLGWRASALSTPQTRLMSYSFWEVLVFLLNAALFALVGLQLPGILDGIAGRPPGQLALYLTEIAVATVAARFLWIYPATYLPRALVPRVRARGPAPRLALPTIIAWSGLRGAVSLAAALAVPVTVDRGGAFPDRDLVIFLAYGTILVTLVLQGLTLPKLIERLGVEDDGGEEAQEVKARLVATKAALARLEELRDEDWVRDETAERVQRLYEYRQRRFRARYDDADESADIEERSLDYQRLTRELLDAQRDRLVEMRDKGALADDVMRRVERDLDLEDNRLET